MKDDKDGFRDAVRELGNIGNIGFFIAFSVLIGLGAGLWLDSVFSTSPFFTLVLVFLGVAAGIIEIFKLGRPRA
jgi:predicted F0F1-ATPase subunit